MGILNRFLLFLFSLVSLVAGGGLAFIAARLVPERMWLDVVNAYVGRPETLAGLAIYLVVGLILLVSVFSHKNGAAETHGEITLASDVAGSVHVSTTAVKGVAERAAMSVRGVRDARTRLHVVRPKNGAMESGVHLSLQLVLGMEAPVKEVTAAVHSSVTQELSALLGLEDVDVTIAVTDITPARLPYQPRVS